MKNSETQNTLTVHILSSIPYHNMNRDDMGMPKNLNSGGVRRSMISSQALKRAARMEYERVCAADSSMRSAKNWISIIIPLVDERANELGLGLDVATRKAVAKHVEKTIKTLAKAPKEEKKDENDSADSKDTGIWLSSVEVEELVVFSLKNWAELEKIDIKEAKKDKDLVQKFFGDLGANRVTGSLAIASFGRMFANAQSRQTDAAIAVSPAVTTHVMSIERDYFTVADDLNTSDSAGAAYIDMANYTSGVYYRSFTIDKKQLERSWSLYKNSEAPHRLGELLEALIYATPSGKKNATAGSTVPLFMLAEVQNHRVAYDFETPITSKSGGYGKPSLDKLLAQRKMVNDFDPNLLGDSKYLITIPDLEEEAIKNAKLNPATDMKDMKDFITNWILAGASN